MEPRRIWNSWDSKAMMLSLFPFMLSGCATFNAMVLPEEKGTVVDRSTLGYGACKEDPGDLESLVAPGAIVSVLFDQAVALTETALQKKERRFTSTYSAKITIDELLPGNCFKFVRTAEGQTVSEIELKVLSRGKNSVELAVHRSD